MTTTITTTALDTTIFTAMNETMLETIWRALGNQGLAKLHYDMFNAHKALAQVTSSVSNFTAAEYQALYALDTCFCLLAVPENTEAQYLDHNLGVLRHHYATINNTLRGRPATATILKELISNAAAGLKAYC